MEVSSYVFKSPYPSRVQIGVEDPSSKNSDSNNDTQMSTTNQTQQKAQSLTESLQSDVKPTVNSSAKLDLYA